MVRVSWSPQALDDVEGIAEYIALDSARYAKLQVQKFFASVKVLETFPFTGRIVPECDNSNLREIIVGGNYRIIYRIINESEVSIVTVHHSNRLLRIEKLL